MATDYNQLLCEKMQKEFDNLIEKFKSKEPAEILKHTYELTIKEDFLSECSLMELEPAKAKALYLCKHPLDRLYNDWLKSDVNYMDMVRDSIDSSVKATAPCCLKEQLLSLPVSFSRSLRQVRR